MEDGDITYQIIGCAMRVYTQLGPGLREKPYENALALDLKAHGIHFSQQPRHPILYLQQVVGDCQPDFVVQDEVIVECKSIQAIGDAEVGQVLNYMRIVKKTVGLIVNFHGTKLEFKRVSL